MVMTEVFPGRGCRGILVILRVIGLDDELIRQYLVDNLSDIDFVTGSDPTSLRPILVWSFRRGC
jgi:hypothetical protein